VFQIPRCHEASEFRPQLLFHEQPQFRMFPNPVTLASGIINNVGGLPVAKLNQGRLPNAGYDLPDEMLSLYTSSPIQIAPLFIA
jgi:hypothetical protein